MRVKSNAKRKKFVKTPGGQSRIHYIKRNNANLRCNSCGSTLNGVKNPRIAKMKKLSKTERVRNQDKYKDICPSCRDRFLKEKVVAVYSSD